MFTLKFKQDNAAFADDYIAEHARILSKIAKQIESGKEYGEIHDVNGNNIGEWSM